jgi:3-phenylpropionate/trans-cinnamate dioxygenase ferredoxin reductase subunit
VTELDTAARTVRTSAGETYPYSACVLATGAAPVTLPVPGGDDQRVLSLRSLGEGTALRDAAAAASSVVVIGSGFIGCEAAASLAGMGKTVTQVSDETVPQVHRLGEDVGRTLAGWLTDAGVTLVGGATVTAVEDGRRVLLAGHDAVEADLVLAAVGAYPLGELADTAGLDVHGGRVVADEHLATSATGVWVAGDVAYARNATAGRHLVVEHWDDAEAMGTIAGTNAAGGDATWDKVPGFWSEIGSQFLQYSAWGDGWDTARFVDHGEGAFTVWYGQDGTTVGVLTCGADEDDEKGRGLISAGAPLPA